MMTSDKIPDEIEKELQDVCEAVLDNYNLVYFVGDDTPVIGGGPGFPDHLLRNDTISFSNYPTDDKSVHLLTLISLHLWRLNDKEKDKIIDFVFRVVTDDENCKSIN